MNENDAQPKYCNIFKVLSIFAFSSSLGSVASYILSFMGGNLSYGNMAGVPDDKAVLYAFLYSTILGAIIVSFMNPVNIRQLNFRILFNAVVKSIIYLIFVWIIIALGGSYISSVVKGEGEWFAISFVLISVMYSLLIIDYFYKCEINKG
jgi:hypothetical protein